MSDPNDLTDAVADAQDAFTHAHGSPEFDPGIDASSEDAGVIQLQKGCQLLIDSTSAYPRLQARSSEQ